MGSKPGSSLAYAFIAKEVTMKQLIVLAALCAAASVAQAQAQTQPATPAAPAPAPAATAAPPTCKAQATEKKLAGAALKSFMTKCQKDASAACDKSAADKKLAGAAKTGFTKKCLTDAVGT